MAALLVALGIAASFLAFHQMKVAAEARKHTLVIMNTADDLLSSLKDAETGERGYLLTGEESFLKPYLMVRDRISGQLQSLRQSTLLSAAEHRLDALAPLMEGKLADMSLNIESRRQHDMIAVISNLHSGQGQQLMDAIRAEMKAFMMIEEGALAQDEAQFQSTMRYLFGIIAAAGLLALLFALAFAYLIYRQIQQRLKNLAHLETEHLLKVQQQTNQQLHENNSTLQISEERLAVTLNAIGDGVIATDDQGCVTLLNPLAEKLTGWSQAQAMGRPVGEIFNVVNPNSRQPVEVPVAAALASGTAQGLNNHIVLIARDGSECEISDSCAPIRNRDAHVVGAVLVFRDVTQEYQAQQAVRDSGALIQTVLNTVADGIITVHARGGIVKSANPAAERMFGYSAAELHEQNFSLLIPELDRDQRDGALACCSADAEALASGVALEVQGRRKDGSLFPLEIVITEMRLGSERYFTGILRDISTRKLADDQGRSAAQYARSLIEASLDPLVTISPEGKITDVNMGSIKVTGVPREKLIGTDFSDYFTEPDRAREGYQQAFSKGAVTDYPLTIRHEDGRLTDVLYNASVYKDVQGNVLGVFAAARDITARKQAEEALLKAGALQSAIFNSANFSSIATDANGVIQIFNVGAERMLGYTAAEVMDKITPADISDPQELVERAKTLSAELGTAITPGFEALVFKASRGIEDIYELTYIRKDSSRLPAVVSVTALRDDQNAIIGYLLIGTDNTARKQVEEEQKKFDQRLRDQQFYTRSLIESNIDALMTTDPSGIITDVNKQMEALTGCTRDELIGAPFKNYFTDPARAEAGIKLVLSEKKVTNYELTVRARDGKEVTVSYNATTFYDRNRTLQGVFASARDVTERKRLDQVLQDKNDELESARFVAEKANLAKSEFLATMSHEIRTPMNGVIGMIDVLQQSSLNVSQMDMANVIHDSAFALLAVINDILDFSKIEASKLLLESIPLSVSDVVEGACNNMSRMAFKNGIELTLFTDPDIPPTVLGDPGRLRQMLINLVNNAIKFSVNPKRAGRVSVRSMLIDNLDGRAMLEFHVTDNGIGIDQATQARLFTAFIQADTSTTRNFGGTGLGLAITRQLVDLMGGQITVRSEPGHGATFSLRIPFMVSDEAPDGVPDLSRHASLKSDPQLVAGLPCLVLLGRDGMAGDLASYLVHDQARVQTASDLAGVRQWLTDRPAGRAVIVLDSADATVSFEALRVLVGGEPEVHFVRVERGRRQGPRLGGAALVLVDGNVLSHRAFLAAVAIAAGRAKVPEREVLPILAGAVRTPLSRGEALRRGNLILIAEDNENNRKVILQQLTLLGQTADIANNGREALKRWQSGDYGILFADLHMPEMDGYELTAAIRALEAGKTRMPIIAFTANALKGEAERCVAIGMDDYLSKPVQLVDLKAMLEKWQAPMTSEAVLPDVSPAAIAAPVLAAAGEFSVVDVRVLKALIGDDEPMIREFLNDFRLSAAEISAELRAAGASGQSALTGALAHKLKSSSRSVGALVLGELCDRLEQAGAAGQAEELARLLPQFEQELVSVDGFLQSYASV